MMSVQILIRLVAFRRIGDFADDCDDVDDIDESTRWQRK